ncbi:MAG: ABC transporter permease [Candidatus Latescibacteria bacterium]|nr:ABC transporter permease [Candidatus Latescibacterota bacterium]
MLKHYLKTAFKVFLRRKFVTLVNLLGICGTLVVLLLAAAEVDRGLGAYAPEVNADRTLKVSSVVLSGDHCFGGSGGAGYLFADRYARRLQTPEKVALCARGTQSAILYQGDTKLTLGRKEVDAAYWEVLRFSFVEGQPFSAQDVAEERPVAIISRRTRRQVFGEGPALGKTLETLAGNYQVVGVVENVPRFQSTSGADFWVPLKQEQRRWGGLASEAGLVGDLQILLLARDPSELPRLKAEYQAMLSQVDLSAVPNCGLYSAADTRFESEMRLVLMRPEAQSVLRAIDPGNESARFGMTMVDDESLQYAKAIWVVEFAGGTLLFMLFPALHLVNLNLSRILERGPEIGVRRAFGASSRALVGQFLVEHLLLTAIGGLLSLPIAAGVLAVLSWEEWGGWAESPQVTLSYPVFLFGLVFVLVFGVLAGIYPAWRMSRLHPAAVLGRGGP